MDRTQVSLIVENYVTQTIALQALKAAYVAMQISRDEAKAAHDKLRTQARTGTLPGIDAAISDHVSDEIAKSLDDALSQVEHDLEPLWQQLERRQGGSSS